MPYLEERVAPGCTHTEQLWQEIREQGYSGSAKQVDKWLRLQRQKLALSAKETGEDEPVSQIVMPHSKTTTRLMISAPEQLGLHDMALLHAVINDERFRALYVHVQQFIALLRKRDVRYFDDWLKIGQLFTISPYRNFVKSLEQDYDAVKAAIELPWSNGQTEGQIHRLKLLKRQMYCRAKLDLLRIRLMQPP